MKLILLSAIVFLFSFTLTGQSLELMLGHERLFADAQWLKFIDAEKRLSLFSRTRATVDSDNNSNLFTGAYLNYTFNIGIGASIVGKINSAGGGVDLGCHIFKARSNWTLFGLASVGLKDRLEYSWFSIFRYHPPINDAWKWYISLELFSLFGKANHLASVQRIRLGVDYKGVQFGLAANLNEIGEDWRINSNFGGFIRKAF